MQTIIRMKGRTRGEGPIENDKLRYSYTASARKLISVLFSHWIYALDVCAHRPRPSRELGVSAWIRDSLFPFLPSSPTSVCDILLAGGANGGTPALDAAELERIDAGELLICSRSDAAVSSSGVRVGERECVLVRRSNAFSTDAVSSG